MARPKKTNQTIQTGRSLPTKFSAYSPGHKTLSAAEPSIKELPNKPSWGRHIAKLLLVFLLALLGAAIVIGVWDARDVSRASQNMFGSEDWF
jgi:hypothetical protein